MALSKLYLDPRNMDNSMSEDENLPGIQKPKFPTFSVFSKRLESFKDWPKCRPVSADILSEAGFIYTGPGDCCICYHCGVGLRQWEAGDNPWSAHAKWYPKCGHVKLVKGQRFIDAVLKGETPEHGSIEPDEAPHEEDHLNSPAALSCLKMGYTKEYVTKATIEFKRTNGHTHYKGTDLGEIIFALKDSEDVDRVNVADDGMHEPENSVVSIEDREYLLNKKTKLEIDCLELKKELLQQELREKRSQIN